MAYAHTFEATGVWYTPLRRAGRFGPADNARALGLKQ